MKKEEKIIKKGNPHQTTATRSQLFKKENYRLMIIGLIVMTVGFFLMVGGRSDNPNVFDYDAIYSFRRITLAPILIVAGLVIEVFAIMKKHKD